MNEKLQPDSFYKIIEKIDVCKNLSEKLAPGFKLIFIFTLLFVIAFVVLLYSAFWREENGLLSAEDGLFQAISKQLPFSASVPITPERDFFKRRLTLRHYVNVLSDQNVQCLSYAGVID